MTPKQEKKAAALLKKGVTNFQKLLKDKNIVSIKLIDGWSVLKYKNGAVFKCRGAVVDNAIICYDIEGA